MKKLLTVLLVMVLCLALTACGGDKEEVYTVGIVQQMPHIALDSATQGFQDALIAELGEGKVDFLLQNAQGDPTTCTTIVNDFTTKNVDLILGNATTALQAAANGTATIPVLGTSVTEYGTTLAIENFDGLVGSNVSGTSDLAPLDEHAAMILDPFPETKTVAMLYCSAEANSQYQVDEVQKFLEEAGLTCTQYPFADSNDMAAVTQTAAAESDVIYVPTDNTVASNTGIIDNICRPAGVPVI
ncbi:MAG: ABC transporter substrate-binding protein, partial [Firmicutes bacterium]|nr:ABC transporter substrate-binding protein [Bacillota bacterium]